MEAISNTSLDILREILPLPYRIVVDGEACVVIRKSEFDLLLSALDEKAIREEGEKDEGRGQGKGTI